MGADGWDCSLLYAVHQMLSLFFPCAATVNGAAATTEERWRRRHLSPGHKAGLLTVDTVCVSSHTWS